MHDVASVIEYGFLIAGVMLVLSAVGISYIIYFIVRKIRGPHAEQPIPRTRQMSAAEKNATLQQIMKDVALIPDEDARARVELLIRLL